MAFDELMGLIALLLVVGVPSLAFATRFVFQPLLHEVVEAINKMSSSRSLKDTDAPELEGRVDRLEELLLTQNDQIERLIEAERFRRGLESGDTVPSLTRPDKDLA